MFSLYRIEINNSLEIKVQIPLEWFPLPKDPASIIAEYCDPQIVYMDNSPMAYTAICNYHDDDTKIRIIYWTFLYYAPDIRVGDIDIILTPSGASELGVKVFDNRIRIPFKDHRWIIEFLNPKIISIISF